MTTKAQMPGSVKSPYGKVAVVELDGSGIEPKMISERARGIKRIVQVWDRQFMGKTDKCAYAIAFKEAQELAEKLNESRD